MVLALGSLDKRKLVCVITVIFVAVCVPASTSAQASLRVLATDPTSPATLGYWEEFYLRIDYTSNRPIRVWAETLSEGKRVTQITSGSPLYDAGSGEVFFWVAYTTFQHIDTIEVTATDNRTGTTIAQTSLPVDVTWTGVRSTSGRVPTEWVQLARAKENAREKAAYAAYMNRPIKWWTSAVFLVVMCSIPVYFILQIVLLWRFRDLWRKLVTIPAVIMLSVLVYTVYAYLDGSNIFPLVLIFTSPLLLLYLLVILGVRRLERKPG